MLLRNVVTVTVDINEPSTSAENITYSISMLPSVASIEFDVFDFYVVNQQGER